MWKHNPFVVSRPFWTYAPGNNPDSRKSTISTRNAFAFFFDKNTHSNGPKLKINRGRIQSENRVYVTSKSILVNKCYSNHHFPNRQFGIIYKTPSIQTKKSLINFCHPRFWASGYSGGCYRNDQAMRRAFGRPRGGSVDGLSQCEARFFLCSTRLTGDFVGFWYKQNAE